MTSSLTVAGAASPRDTAPVVVHIAEDMNIAGHPLDMWEAGTVVADSPVDRADMAAAVVADSTAVAAVGSPLMQDRRCSGQAAML